jgi:hypothetical protein
MANILHPKTYSEEGLPLSERDDMIRGRKLSRAIVAWVIGNYETEEMSTELFYWKYLVYQARAVCHAKDFGDANNAYGYTGVRLSRKVRPLLEMSFRDIKSFWAEWESFGDFEPDTFAWPKADPVIVKTRNIKLQGMCAARAPDK